MPTQLAIDIGGTGIKGALVDTSNGQLLSERKKYETPQPATAESMLKVIDQLIVDFEWKGKSFGAGFPAIVKKNICYTANNIDKSWIGVDIGKAILEHTKTPCFILNDADAAGIAEVQFGNGVGQEGTVILLTLGTGIGSSMFKNGSLLFNTELGSLYYKKDIAEYYVSNKARKRDDMDWEEYGTKLNEYLLYINRIFNPNLTILGGGISKKLDKFKDYFDPSINVKPAQLLNNAGIIGAALFCETELSKI